MALDQKVIAVEYVVRILIPVPVSVHRSQIAPSRALDRLREVAPGLFTHKDIQVSKVRGMEKIGRTKTT